MRRGVLAHRDWTLLRVTVMCLAVIAMGPCSARLPMPVALGAVDAQRVAAVCWRWGTPLERDALPTPPCSPTCARSAE